MKKKWILICIICATPSFTLALFAGFDGLAKISAMLLGIVTFIVAFSHFEGSNLNSRLSSNREFSRAKSFAIGAKLATALIAFVGCLAFAFQVEVLSFLALIEVYPGLFSIQIVESIWNALGLESPIKDLDMRGEMGLGQWYWNQVIFTYLTTLVQGTILSVVMILFGILSYPIYVALGKW